MSDILRMPTRNLDQAGTAPAISAEQLRRRLRNSRIMATFLLIPGLPIIGFCALLVRLTSKGSPIYKQERVGLHGETFTLYKIRSMVIDAETSTGAVWAQSADPRVTAIGRFLRFTHLDELPQLFNILKGEMCINGPRPERPEFVCDLVKLVPRYEERLSLHPGVTGLAQVQAPADQDLQTVRNKLSLDLAYIEHLSTERALDLRILGATVCKMLAIPGRIAARWFRLDSIERAQIPQRTSAVQPRKAA